MTRRSSAGTLVALALAAAPRAAAAGEFRITPYFSISQMHDDNLFATPAAESDDISRLGAGLAAARRSPRLTVKGRYAVEAERFRLHPELSRAAARHDAALGLEWAASPRLGVALSADYVDTQTPSELNVLTGLEVGRRRGRRLSTGALFTHRLGPRTTSRLEHRFNRDRVAGLPGNDAHAIVVGLDRELGTSDRGSVGYRAQRIAFGADATLSHTVTVGWNRELTRSTQLALETGPRLTGRRLGVEASAGLRRQLRHGHASIDYTRSQTIVLGQPGPVTVEGVRAAFSHRVAGPLWFNASPGVFRVAGSVSGESTLYGVTSELAWRVARSVTVSGTHQFGRQEGGLAPGSSSQLTHNTFALALTRRSTGE
jgi:hypothetical protein